MHYPPAPVLGRHQIAALAVHQSGSVEKRDRNTGNQEHHQQRIALVALCEGRPKSAPHKPQPEDQPDEQQDLPEAAKVDIFITLCAEPEPVIAEAMLNAEPLARERSDYD